MSLLVGGATNERARSPGWSTVGRRAGRTPSLQPRLPAAGYDLGLGPAPRELKSGGALRPQVRRHALLMDRTPL